MLLLYSQQILFISCSILYYGDLTSRYVPMVGNISIFACILLPHIGALAQNFL